MQTKAEIKKTWNEIAKRYSSYRRKAWGGVKEFLSEVDDDLLDIGAGYCPNTRQVLAKGVKLYAVDISEEMLKGAPEEAEKIVETAKEIKKLKEDNKGERTKQKKKQEKSEHKSKKTKKSKKKK